MTTLLAGATQVVTCRGPARARRGNEMADLDVIDRGGVVMADDGTIAAVGPEPELRQAFPGATVEEVEGVLFPGFVDIQFRGRHLIFFRRKSTGIYDRGSASR